MKIIWDWVSTLVVVAGIVLLIFWECIVFFDVIDKILR